MNSERPQDAKRCKCKGKYMWYSWCCILLAHSNPYVFKFFQKIFQTRLAADLVLPALRAVVGQVTELFLNSE